MRWFQVGMSVLAVTSMSGCPSEFGKEGRIAKAIHKDTVELVITRCSEERRKEVCGAGKQHTPECQACLSEGK